MTFLLIATGNYKQYIHQCVASIKEFIPDALIYLFTDTKEGDFQISHQPWPYVTLYRFHYFLKAESHIIGDHIYFMDIDAKMVSKPSIIGDLVAVRHSGHYFEDSKQLPQETNIKSTFHHYPFTKYYGGGFFGGNRQEFFDLCRWCKAGIDADVNNDIIPRHNDETALNAYLSIRPPTLELSPSYHYPGDNEYIKTQIWKGRDFTPVIWLLEKNHEIVRA